MMHFMNFDLAKAITEDRRAKSLAAAGRRRRALEELPSLQPVTSREADVVELVFPTRCQPDQIGA